MAKDEQKDLEARFADLAARNAQLMAALEAKLEAQAPTGGITADVLEKILTRATAAAGQATEVLAKKMKPENADHLHVSPFEHPEGGLKYPKPALVRDLVFMGRVKEVDLTYAEVLAVNALNATLTRGQRRVCRDGKWVAAVTDDDKTLTVSVPAKSIDDRQDLPPLIQIMQELTSGERTQDMGELAQELALLKLKVSELTGASV